jgi:hypothetical protein
MAPSEVARSEEYNAGRGISVSLGFQRLLQFSLEPLRKAFSVISRQRAQSDHRQVFVLNRIREEAKNVS